MADSTIKKAPDATLATLSSTVSMLSTKITSGKFAIINARGSTANLNTIYEGQDGASVAFLQGQNEVNAPIDGTLHFVLSFKYNASYGVQVAFPRESLAKIYIRILNNGTWSTWRTIFEDAGKAVISERFTGSYTIGANTYKQITTADLGASIPSGYTPFSVIEVSTGANNVAFRSVNVANLSSSTGAVIVARNLTSSAVDATASLRVGFIKSDLLGK